jgi:hypothetical protein
MSKLGTSKKPLVLRVRSVERAQEVAAQCEQLNVKYIVGIEEDQPENLTDLHRCVRKPKAANSFWRLK